MRVQIVAPWPDDDELSEALRKLTHAIDFVGAADGKAGGLFGGQWGYGADYENDVFLMHRYCWCEQESCPWCGGCSDVGQTDVGPHAPTCYQTRLLALRKRYGRRMRGDYWSVPTGENSAYEKAKRALCQELRRSYTNGNEVHCTCGAERAWRRRFAACECDWHLGRNQFRFGRATSAPHFWHKASGAQVRWYKYIGRGMEVTPPSVGTWSDVFSQCHASLESPTAVDAVARSATSQHEPSTREEKSSHSRASTGSDGRQE